MTIEYLHEQQRWLTTRLGSLPDSQENVCLAIEAGNQVAALDRMIAALRLAQTFHIPVGTYKEGVE